MPEEYDREKRAFEEETEAPPKKEGCDLRSTAILGRGLQRVCIGTSRSLAS
jgi:hypothetical protein